MHIRYYLHNLIEVIERNYCVEKHEKRFWDFEYIFHLSCRSRFEIADTVIADITDGTTSQRREGQVWDDGFAKLGQFRFQ